MSQQFFRLLCVLSAFLMPASTVMLAQAIVDAGAPTAGEDPLAIDRTWQKASAKYDSARAAVLESVDKINHAGPFRPDWESLETYKVPDWYLDAKFGIFIHWGVYSVPAFGNEWYPRNMYNEGSDEYKHHIATYGPQDKFGYKDFITRFKAEKYDPEAWARLFKEAGAKYVVPVFEHHDGFAMYDNGLSDWTAVKMGPHRDLWGDLAKAVRAEGLHLGASSHRVEHNFFLGVGRSIQSDVNDPSFAAFYGQPIAGFRRRTIPRCPTTSRLSPRPGRMTGWRARRKSSRNITPTSCISIGGSASLRFERI